MFSFFIHPHGSFGFLSTLLGHAIPSASHAGVHEEHECLNRCETLAVFLVDLCRYLHAMVADEVVNHFQLVEKGFFVERLALR